MKINSKLSLRATRFIHMFASNWMTGYAKENSVQPITHLSLLRRLSCKVHGGAIATGSFKSVFKGSLKRIPGTTGIMIYG